MSSQGALRARLSIRIDLRAGSQCRTRFSGRRGPLRKTGHHRVHTYSDGVTCPAVCAARDRTVKLQAGQAGTQRAKHEIGGGIQTLRSRL